MRAQCDGAGLVALDSMNLWIETARDSLVAAIGEVDCLLLNDAELRMLTEEPNLARAAGAAMELGPADRRRQARGVRRRAVHAGRRSSRSRASCSRTSATRPAPATASPAASSATSTAQARATATTRELRRAMAYGSVLASFNVEDFGTERVSRLTRDEIEERLAEFKRLTHFEERPERAG